MVLRVKPTLTRFPTNSLYTPMDNTSLHSISSVCHPWGKLLLLLRRSAKSSISQEERLATSPNPWYGFTCRTRYQWGCTYVKLTLFPSHRKRRNDVVFEKSPIFVGRIFDFRPTFFLPRWTTYPYILFQVAIAGRSQQDVHYLGGAFVGHIARPLRQRFVYFMPSVWRL